MEFLHEDKERFLDAINVTIYQTGLSAEATEKDSFHQWNPDLNLLLLSSNKLKSLHLFASAVVLPFLILCL